jgi:membrane protease YdiL (CAAX protease family)
VSHDGQILRLMLSAGLLVASAAGLVSVALRIWANRFASENQDDSLPAWMRVNGWMVLLGFCFIILIPSVSQSLLISSGFYLALYGDEFSQQLSKQPTPDELAAATIRSLWADALSFPLQIGLMLGILFYSRGYQFIRKKLPDHFVSGYFVWLFITPLVFLIYIVVNYWMRIWINSPPDQHPLTRVSALAGPREWILFCLEAIVLAPIREEFLFRGLLLTWIMAKQKPAQTDEPRLPYQLRSPLIFALAIAITSLHHLPEAFKAWTNNNQQDFLNHLLPTLFIALLYVFDLLLPSSLYLRRKLKIRSPQQVRAIVASSALFAAFHATVWPSPVPLFFLSLGLGVVFVRTRSLITPIVLHGLFNAVSATFVLLGGSS